MSARKRSGEQLRSDYLLLSKPRRVFDGLLDVLPLEIGIAFEDS
jgi:hypothetical protein